MNYLRLATKTELPYMKQQIDSILVLNFPMGKIISEATKTLTHFPYPHYLRNQTNREQSKKQKVDWFRYLGIEAQLPDFRGWSFESGDGGVGVDVEDTNEAVERSRGGDEPRRVSRHRRHAQAVARVGALPNQLVGAPEPHGLVQRPGQ